MVPAVSVVAATGGAIEPAVHKHVGVTDVFTMYLAILYSHDNIIRDTTLMRKQYHA